MRYEISEGIKGALSHARTQSCRIHLSGKRVLSGTINPVCFAASRQGVEHYRDHVSPRPSTKINSRLATAAVAIHTALRCTGPTCSSSLPLLFRIMKGRLNRPALAPNVDGRADAMT